jgi:phospholipase/carboxylesterase
MDPMPSGLHHVTLVTRRAQANLDFYVGLLGLRLVKRTAGFEDAAQLHLFYGDTVGAPGSLVTFLAWEDGAPGRPGLGQATELSLAVPPASIGYWLTRLMTAGARFAGPVREFGEPVLRLTDPDGITVKLVGAELPGPAVPRAGQGVPAEHAVRRLRGALLLSDRPAETAAFLARHFGYREAAREAGLTRLLSGAGDALDVRDATGFWPGAPGTGTVDHLAFRALDLEAVRRAFERLAGEGREATPPKDRRYFASTYAREPGGVLCELATDGPGMAVDEPVERLGEGLFVPPDAADRAEEIRLVLPELALPGEEREVRADLPFVHRLRRPSDPDGSALVLLHGTGGHETDLMPFAHRVAPRAALLGFRGRSTEEGVLRWFRRPGPTRFDQADIAREAEAFAATVAEAQAFYGLDPARTTVLGHSNGANFAAAAMLLHPGPIRRAVLLRPILVLDEVPPADLTGTSVLVIAGAADPYGPHLPALVEALRRAGASVAAETVSAGHGIVPADTGAARAWLHAGTAP